MCKGCEDVVFTRTWHGSEVVETGYFTGDEDMKGWRLVKIQVPQDFPKDKFPDPLEDWRIQNDVTSDWIRITYCPWCGRQLPYGDKETAPIQPPVTVQ